MRLDLTDDERVIECARHPWIAAIANREPGEVVRAAARAFAEVVRDVRAPADEALVRARRRRGAS